MPTLSKLLESNHKWAADITAKNPEFFSKLSSQQNPDYLWIGCSDSRIPPNQITGSMPGEIFVHRNIANMVIHTDLNLLSVLQYAVEVLKVKHIIVCGHYGCGGVKAAAESKPYGLIDNWLRHIQDVKTLNTDELNALNDEEQLNRLCELNVIAQAENLCRTSILKEAWARNQAVEIHSWIYNLNDGCLRPLCDIIKSAR